MTREMTRLEKGLAEVGPSYHAVLNRKGRITLWFRGEMIGEASSTEEALRHLHAYEAKREAK